MTGLLRGTLAALTIGAPALAAPSSLDEDALAALFSFGYGEEPHFQQVLELDGCDARLTLTAYAEPGGVRRLSEVSRFELEHFAVVDGESEGVLELTARDYFSRAGDEGLGRWLEAIAATARDEQRSARLRELQTRVELGEFGRFAARNGYESRSFLEGDVEPYYALTLPAVALRLPEEHREEALDAWRTYAGEHCAN